MKKILAVLKQVFDAIVRFIVFPYAPSIVVGIFGLVELLGGHKFFAVIIFAFAILFARNEFIKTTQK
jgi:hypothetical protein